MSNQVYEAYMARKVCLKCYTAQSIRKTSCLRKRCNGALRLRKEYKKR